MIKTLPLICCIALAAHAQRPLKWIADATTTAPVTFDCSRGETLTFAPVLKAYGITLTNYTASFVWQTNGMGSLCWSTNILAFTPSMDYGANKYRFWIRAETTGGVVYSAQGTINMLHAPGAIVNALPLPVQQIDFAATAWTNAPWLLSELDPGIPAAVASAVAQASSNLVEFAATNKTTILHGNTTSWQTVENGTATVWRIEDGADINTATLTVTEPLTVDGGSVVLPVGVYTSIVESAGVFIWSHNGTAFGYYTYTPGIPLTSCLLFEDDSSAWYGHNGSTGTYVFPDVLTNLYGTAIGGKVTVDYGRASVTNRYPLATVGAPSGLSGTQVANIVLSVIHTNQFWASPLTNVLIRQYWDATNGTFAVEEILP